MIFRLNQTRRSALTLYLRPNADSINNFTSLEIGMVCIKCKRQMRWRKTYHCNRFTAYTWTCLCGHVRSTKEYH